MRLPATADALRDRIAQWAAVPASDAVAALLDPLDEWAVTPQVAWLLTQLVRDVAPDSVLEFGAGRSSLVLASAMQQAGGGRLTSIEHQPAYAEPSWRRMQEFPAVEAELVPTRLTVQLSRNGLLHAYDGVDAVLKRKAPFDLVFIDAPPGHLGRDATLLAAAPYLAPGALVLVDDARRQSERTAARRWERALRVARIFESDDVGRGVLLLQVAEPSRPAFSMRTFFGTIHDRILEGRART